MRLLLLVVTLVTTVNSFSQTKVPILERKISISLSNERIPEALARIAQEGKFSFSYNPSLVNGNQPVSIKASDKTVRDILNDIFKGSLNFKEKNDHLIVTKSPRKEQSTKVVVISGYVEDANTKAKIAHASVYDKQTIKSAVTDDYGYFTMKLDKEQSGSIAVSKKNYQDTLVAITAPDDQYLTLSISPIANDSLKISAAASSDSTHKKHRFRMPFYNRPNIQNIHDTLHREFQVSFVPFIGSNGLLSGNVINDYSLNLLGGYSMGTRKIELAGLFNLDRGDVSYLQMAGFANVVGGSTSGFQLAGFFNINGRSTSALQAAGYFNLNMKDYTGVQLAGFTNVNLGSTHGGMIAGFSNISKGPSGGIQLAGFTNIVTADYNGSQISGFFNYAKKINGSQLSVFNYADSLTGVPIGVFSYVKHGYHKVDVYSDEIFYTNVSLRSGIKKFYNILFAGMKPKPASGNQNVWTFGYGVGTAPKLTRWLDLNIDITSQQVNKGSLTKEMSLLNKVYVGFDCKLAKKFSLIFGATLNGYLTKNDYTDYPVIFTDFKPHVFSDTNHGDHANMKMWWGAKVGLRFF